MSRAELEERLTAAVVAQKKAEDENAKLRQKIEELQGSRRVPLQTEVTAWAQQHGSNPPPDDAVELHSRFAAAADTFEYSYGDVSQFFAGLEGLVGVPSPDFLRAMAYEHVSDEPFQAWNADVPRRTTPRIEHQYVMECAVGSEPPAMLELPGGRRDSTDQRAGWRLADFARQPDILTAGCLLAEVAGLRLYTGPMYSQYNGVLRIQRKGKYVTTLHAINSGIIKLARQTKAATVYRGVSGGHLPERFWQPNDKGVMGGVERGFMSTTTDRNVALGYMRQQGREAMMLFEIRMGMIDSGADLHTLSQFPAEREILFAPLTGLEVASAARAEEGVLIVELRLSCNLHDLTLEQVVSKMQRSHVALVEGILDDLRYAGAPQGVMRPLIELRARAEARGREHFNVPALFLQATSEALELRTKAMASTELWSEAAWDDGSALAIRMRGMAALCARNEMPDAAAALLSMAVEREPVPMEHRGMVATECLVWQHEPSATQRRALEALSLLLAEDGGGWGLTMVALADEGGNASVAGHLALRHGRAWDTVEGQLFDEDATARACKGSRLLSAAEAGDMEAVSSALGAGADANESSENGVTSLMLASHVDAPGIVHALLEAKADTRAKSRRGCTALGLAAMHGGAEVVHALLAVGSDIDAMDDAGFAPLIMAAARGHTETVEALLEGGAAVNLANSKDGYTALMHAAAGHDATVKALMAGGAAVNLTNSANGTTALLVAARNGQEAAVEALLEGGATVNLTNSKTGTTALIQAANKCHEAVVKALLMGKAAADLHNNEDGTTALMVAASNGDEATVKALLASGAAVNLTNSKTGTTALCLAQHGGHTTVAHLLEEAGSREDGERAP